MLDATLSALSDPTRRAIVGLLAERERSVGEVVKEFDLTQSAISRHLDVLANANLIERRREGQKRVCSLSAEPLRELSDWLEDYRKFWIGSFERLDSAIARKKR
ncbi:MAG: metalloregulator ArsR/SmtB family transcription factor [Pseudomonadota bacterium]